MARMTKQQAVLEWLQTGAGITSMEAFKSLGATRLSAIIFELRAKGYDIASERVKVSDRFGGITTVSRYYLRDTDSQQDEKL